MHQKIQSNYFILTGAMGSGKSTIAEALSSKGLEIVAEPARQILAEQRLFEGNGVPEKNAQLFTELMLSRSLYHYNRLKDSSLPILFDRAVPDMIAYASLFNIDLDFTKAAAEAYRYHKFVFVTADWSDIYATDDERKMSYEQAKAFGESLKDIYQTLGYELIEVPKLDVSKRADFILGHIYKLL